MQIEFTQTEERGTFAATEDGRALGALNLDLKAEGVVVAHRTFVDPEARGMGVAGKLLAALLTWARANQMKIVPACSYVQRKMAADEATHDLLAEGAPTPEG